MMTTCSRMMVVVTTSRIVAVIDDGHSQQQGVSSTVGIPTVKFWVNSVKRPGKNSFGQI